MQNKHPFNLDLHEAPSEFLAAIQYTVSTLGFRAELIEKDYFCSLVLEKLFSHQNCPLIFKGGTLLSKVYGEFFRLSEDLDLTLPVPTHISRRERKSEILPIKDLFDSLASNSTGIKIGSPLIGSNESRQYNGELIYESIITDAESRIRFEVSVSEPLLDNLSRKAIRTLLINPFTSSQYVKEFHGNCFTAIEAYAEKTRAALCRREPAIRDFFDLYHARKESLINLEDEKFIAAVLTKIQNQSKDPIDLSQTKYHALKDQIQSELFPTLRTQDYDLFELDHIFNELKRFANLHFS